MDKRKNMTMNDRLGTVQEQELYNSKEVIEEVETDFSPPSTPIKKRKSRYYIRGLETSPGEYYFETPPRA